MSEKPDLMMVHLTELESEICKSAARLGQHTAQSWISETQKIAASILIAHRSELNIPN